VRRACLVWTLILVVFAAGCSSEREKGINKDQDKPKKAEEKR